MIEHTVMDYEGKPVSIEDGEIYEVDAPYKKVWNSEWCEWEKAPVDEVDYFQETWDLQEHEFHRDLL